MKQFEHIYIESNKVKTLREATYSFTIDPLDRSWVIMPQGELLSDVSHTLMLKREFANEWNACKDKMNDDDIEKLIISRLLNIGGIKVGELRNYFYAVTKRFDNNTMNLLSAFGEALLKAYPSQKDSIINIEGDITLRCTIEELANDFLFKEIKI